MEMIGAVLLMTAGVGYGISERRALLRRIGALERCERLIHRIAEHIRCTAAPMHEVLHRLAASKEWSTFPLLKEVVARLSEDGEFVIAWTEAVTRCAEEWRLSERERDVLTNFAAGLGKTDVEGEYRYCEQYESYLKDCLQIRRAEWQTHGRLYTVLGVCGGGAAALLLL